MRTIPYIALLALLFLPTRALAQRGFALDRFQPAPTSEDGLALTLPRTLGHLRSSFGLTLDYAHQPLVIARPKDAPDSALVEHRLLGHLSAGLGLGSRAEVFVRAPIMLASHGDTPGTGFVGQRAPKSGALGMLQLGGTARVLGADDGPLTLGASGWLELPTGSKSRLTGDHGVGLGGLVTAAAHFGLLSFAGNLGGRYRTRANYGTSRIGSELLIGAGAYARATEQLTFLSELNGALTLRELGHAGSQSAPFELLFGARYSTPFQVLVTGAAGLGLTHAVGTPDARALLQVAYPNPRLPTQMSDSDGDGIANHWDVCPGRPEDKDGFQDEDGCPDNDNDRDGVLDTRDQCLNDPEDLDGFQDVDGCPDNDNDNDHVVDASDGCPNVPEDRDGFQDEDGCADLDNDRDGLPDPHDGCPSSAEDNDGFADEDGCPEPDNDLDGVLDADDNCPTVPGPSATKGCPSAVRIDRTQIRILERIEFQTLRAEIRPESLGILDQIRGALAVNPQLRRVRIEGHTDNRGATMANEKLSQRRAESVMNYLVREGIDPSRLEAKGWGEERPLVKNDSEENMQINRRVEFHIVDPAPPQSSLGGAQ